MAQIKLSYQIRHKEFGVYQGSCIGFGFWHPMSNMPEQGFCEFPTYSETLEYIKFLCSDKCDDPLRREDFSIENYDRDESERLQVTGQILFSQSVN